MSQTDKRHILTINAEDYFQVGAFKNIIPTEHWDRFETRIQQNIEKSLQLLEDTANTATFFVSGWVATSYPHLIRGIVEAGHEVSCSGFYHQSLRNVSEETFRKDLRRSKEAVELATRRAVNGFRVGRGRITPEQCWVLDTLVQEGFLYDSSVMPIGREFANSPNWAKLHLHETQQGQIWEVPPSTCRIGGLSIPFFGGNYIRQLPMAFSKRVTKNWLATQNTPLVMYFHIWELDTNQPTISGAKWLQSVRHYRNLNLMQEKIRYFLEQLQFSSVENILDLARSEPANSNRLLATSEIENNKRQPSQPKTRMSVIVPCYNEEASLDYLARTLANFTDSSERLSFEFVFVDDGSDDDTSKKLHELFGSKDDAIIVQHENNKGIAAAILTGSQAASADYLAVIDADCTFDPMQLNDMFDQMRSDCVAICASPFHESGLVSNVPKWRLTLSKGAAFLYSCVLNHKFSSYTSCFRIYRREALEAMELRFGGFCGVAEILAQLDLGGHKLQECSAQLQSRVLGSSKIKLFSTILNHLELVARIALARWFKIPLSNTQKVGP